MPTLVDREVACWSVIAVGTAAAVIAVVAAGGIIPALAGPVSPNHLEKPGPNMVPATHEAPAAVETEPVASRDVATRIVRFIEGSAPRRSERCASG